MAAMWIASALVFILTFVTTDRLLGNAGVVFHSAMGLGAAVSVGMTVCLLGHLGVNPVALTVCKVCVVLVAMAAAGLLSMGDGFNKLLKLCHLLLAVAFVVTLIST